MKRRGSQRGSGFIELALLFSVMLLIFLGVADFALVIQESMVVTDAAYAGAQYGAMAGNTSDFTGMQNIAGNAAKGVSGFSATASKWCSCTPGGTSVSCSTTCAIYGTPIAYVQVVTTATASVLFKYTGIPLSIPLRGVCILRVQ